MGILPQPYSEELTRLADNGGMTSADVQAALAAELADIDGGTPSTTFTEEIDGGTP